MMKAIFLLLPIRCWAIFWDCTFCPQPVVYQSALPAPARDAVPSTVMYSMPRYRLISLQEPVKTKQQYELVEVPETDQELEVDQAERIPGGDVYDPFGPIRHGYGLQPSRAPFRSGKTLHHHSPASMRTGMSTQGPGGTDSYYPAAETQEQILIDRKINHNEAHIAMPAVENSILNKGPPEIPQSQPAEQKSASQSSSAAEYEESIMKPLSLIEKEHMQSAEEDQEFLPIEKDKSRLLKPRH